MCFVRPTLRAIPCAYVATISTQSPSPPTAGIATVRKLQPAEGVNGGVTLQQSQGDYRWPGRERRLFVRRPQYRLEDSPLPHARLRARWRERKRRTPRQHCLRHHVAARATRGGERKRLGASAMHPRSDQDRSQPSRNSAVKHEVHAPARSFGSRCVNTLHIRDDFARLTFKSAASPARRASPGNDLSIRR